MSDFYVGQKVVCIDNGSPPGMWWASGCPLENNAIYTIRGIGITLNETPGVRLIGVKYYRLFSDTEDMFFGEWRFRPLESKAIEIFRKIAQDVTDGKKVDINA